MHQFLKFILGMKLYMFGTVPLSIIRRFSLYTQHLYMSYSFADSLRAGSGWKLYMFRTVPLSIIRSFSLYTHSNGICNTDLLCVQWKSPDDGQRNCPKHVEFHSKKKIDYLLHLDGFIIRKAKVDDLQKPPEWFHIYNKLHVFMF